MADARLSARARSWHARCVPYAAGTLRSIRTKLRRRSGVRDRRHPASASTPPPPPARNRTMDAPVPPPCRPPPNPAPGVHRQDRLSAGTAWRTRPAAPPVDDVQIVLFHPFHDTRPQLAERCIHVAPCQIEGPATLGKGRIALPVESPDLAVAAQAILEFAPPLLRPARPEQGETVRRLLFYDIEAVVIQQLPGEVQHLPMQLGRRRVIADRRQAPRLVRHDNAPSIAVLRPGRIRGCKRQPVILARLGHPSRVYIHQAQVHKRGDLIARILPLEDPEYPQMLLVVAYGVAEACLVAGQGAQTVVYRT